MRLQLNFAGGNYDFVRPLADGTVKPDGIDLNVLSGMGSGERHHRMGRGQEFDICEFNAAGNVWMRGILQEHHGVPHREVTWFVERDDAVNFKPPAGLRVERVPAGVRAEKMMLDGELDAILSPDLPHAFLAGDKRIARLFADNKEREVAYFKQTGIFPIMHVTLIKQEIVDRHPWVATNLMKAFNQAKEHAYRRILNPRNVALAWVRNALEEQLAVLGNDPWEFGLTPRNRKTLETLQRYCAQQGIVGRERPLEELFVDAGRVSIPEEF